MEWLVFAVIFFQVISSTKADGEGSETELLKQVIGPAAKLGRPVLNYSDPVKLYIGLEVSQVILSTKLQQLSISGFFRMKWQNELVHWNVSEYNGIKNINVDPDLVWTPETVLYNSVRQGGTWISGLLQTKVSIDNTGTSYWLSPIDFMTTCHFQIKQFPFDTQECEIIIGPWTEDVSKVYSIGNGLPTITPEGFIPNVEWTIAKTEQVVEAVYYECCPIPFRLMKIRLTLTRKPLFYTINCIAPCIFLLVILLVGHLLPPESGERITLSIMISLTFILMMEFTSSILPLTSEISSLSRIYLILTIVISLSIFITCYVLTLYHRVITLLWIPRFLEKRFIPKALWVENIKENQEDDELKLQDMKSLGDEGKIKRNQSLVATTGNAHMSVNGYGSSLMANGNATLRKILQEIKHYNKETNTPNVEDDYQLRARHIAVALDKFFIALMLVILTGAMLADVFL